MVALVLVFGLQVKSAHECWHDRPAVPLRTGTPLVEHRRALNGREPLRTYLLHIRVEHIQCDCLFFQVLLLRKVPDEKSDGEVACRAIEALDRENEAALVFVLEEPVAYLLIVVGVDVLQLREHAEVGLPVLELLRDAEKELREEFAARLTVAFLVHPFAKRGHRDRVLGLLPRLAADGVGGGKRRIDEDDPLDLRVREIGGEVGRHLARLAEGHLPGKCGYVVREVVILEAGCGGEYLLAVFRVLGFEGGDVAVR